jgi:hypothetical protein
MARASRNAGDACGAMAARSGPPGEAARWRSRAADWYARSLDLYRSLAAAGSLPAAEVATVDEVAKRLTSVR